MITIEDENDLWKLFSEAPDQPGTHIRTFNLELRTVLKTKIKLTDTTRFYHLYRCGYVVGQYSAESAKHENEAQAIVSQANLRTVGLAMARRFNDDIAVQYLGPLPGKEAA